MSDKPVPVMTCSIPDSGRGCGSHFCYKTDPGLCMCCIFSEAWEAGSPDNKVGDVNDPEVYTSIMDTMLVLILDFDSIGLGAMCAVHCEQNFQKEQFAMNAVNYLSKEHSGAQKISKDTAKSLVAKARAARSNALEARMTLKTAANKTHSEIVDKLYNAKHDTESISKLRKAAFDPTTFHIVLHISLCWQPEVHQ
ncbi:hypothetical protein BS47DRAFT_1360447 [Hydnum rufescens UP504]|uniref:Uncharacterized protein n=1 Tax=Hydnum rufescens UP504 TaxID=1448309 RepID=A0A9P6DVC1_9AGAM|nr:hypothetical protein BS47DRAFT_1360447 [Hydnum rufescens UP504]